MRRKDIAIDFSTAIDEYQIMAYPDIDPGMRAPTPIEVPFLPTPEDISHVRLDIRNGSALISQIPESGFPRQQSLGSPGRQRDRAVGMATIDFKAPFLLVNHDLIHEVRRRKDAKATVPRVSES